MSKFDFNRINRDTPPADVNKIGKNFEAIEELALTEVDTDDIIDKAVTTEKIADGAITSDKISSDFKIGDMLKSTYDKNGNGIVDDSEKLGGQLPEYYAVKENPVFSGENGIKHTAKQDHYVNRSLKVGGDFLDTVVLLHEIYDDVLIDANYCKGKFSLHRGAVGTSHRGTIAEIISGSAYGSTFGTLMESNHNSERNGYLVKCRYNDKLYMGYVIPYYGATWTAFNFVGWVKSTGELLLSVNYYNRNASTVLNAEIYNSLTPWESNITPRIAGSMSIDKSLTVPWIQRGNWIEGYLGHITTTHNVANEKVSMVFGKIHMNGWLEIEISATAWWQNSNGRLCRRFALSTNPEGGSTIASDFFAFADPSISCNFGISDLQWSPTVGWYIQIGKLQPQDGNQYHIFIRASGTDLPQKDLLYVSKIYTDDVTALDAPVPQIPLNTVMRSGTVDYEIATIRKVGTDKTNIIFGQGSGSNITTATNNIFIGNNLNNMLGIDSGYIRIGNPTDMRFCHIAGIYDSASASGVSVLINSSHKLGTTTSSLRYKKNIEDVKQEYVDTFFDNARPIWYQSNTELCVNDNPNYGWWGFIAEELAEFDPRLVHFDYHEDDYEIVKKTRLEIRMIPNPDYKQIDYEDTPQEIEEKYEEEYLDKVLKDGAVKSPRAVHYDRITVLLTKEMQRMREKEKQQDKIIQDLIKRIEKLETKKG